MALTPQDFVTKWKPVTSRERQTYQEHFIDLCRLVGHPTPNEADHTGTHYAFEMGTAKTSGGQGWADVAKLGYFGWEYKKKDSNLDKAYEQLLRYRDALQNPPLLIVSDINQIIIRTNFTNQPTRTYTIALDEMLDPENLRILRLVFTDPEKLKPVETVESVTKEAAGKFAQLAENLRRYGSDPQEIAHFLIRLLFCLFAEDIGLLPERLFPRLLDQTRRNSNDFSEVLRQLFRAMNTGGYFGADRILHFNGGLFDDDRVLPLDSADMNIIADIDALDWGAIKPSIFGTLFERGLDPDKRSLLGAHYTDESDILLIVEPVLMAPLRREWEELQVECRRLKEGAEGLTGKKRSNIIDKIKAKLFAFADRIASVTVLDPACGSGNFLYIALRLLLDLQNEVINFSDEMGAGRFFVSVTPAQLYGIETNEYAHELAQMTIQIGYIQWLRDNGYGRPSEPILKQVKNIQHMDAVLAYGPRPDRSQETAGRAENRVRTGGRDDGGAGEDLSGLVKEPEWPPVDVIVGNPPFLGGKRMRTELGDEYVNRLFALYDGRVPREADLVCYWFEKARAMIEKGQVNRAGLLATNSIRGGANRKVLERIKETGDIFWAQSDRDWILDGAAVNVSMVGFSKVDENVKMLDGKVVGIINPDLTTSVNITIAARLPENKDICFMGITPGGSFAVSDDLAMKWLSSANNPNGKPNTDVLRKYFNGQDIVSTSRGVWLIDFGNMHMDDASSYELPFEYVKVNVKPFRDKNKRASYREKWWLHAESRPAMRKAINGLPRYIATPRVSKHRIFIWIPGNSYVDSATFLFSRDDDYFFGVLHSKLHEIWALKQGTSLEDRPRYTPTTTFETFPFPWAPGQEPAGDPRLEAIAQAARELVEQRERWLTPSLPPPNTTTQTLNADSASFSSDLGEVPERSEWRRGSKKRTLTNLYNQRPTWLELAHKKLDEAVSAAYGWPSDLSDEEILERLLSLNLERGGKT